MNSKNHPVALISGAASGIGLSLAQEYARKGVRIVAGYYSKDPHDFKEAAAQVEKLGGDALWLDLDVGSTPSVKDFARKGYDHFGRIDYVVANAGILRHNPIGEMTDEAWSSMLNVDLTGVMRMFREAALLMKGAGSMVAISSIAGGFYGWQEHAHYAAAKAGVIGICRSMAVELADRGIRCNSVMPGLIRTPQSLDSKNSLGEEGLRKAALGIPLKRIGNPEEVAKLIYFLTSEDSSYITGQNMTIDGGLTIRWPD